MNCAPLYSQLNLCLFCTSDQMCLRGKNFIIRTTTHSTTVLAGLWYFIHKQMFMCTMFDKILRSAQQILFSYEESILSLLWFIQICMDQYGLYCIRYSVFECLSGLLTLVAPLDFEVSREYYLSVEGSRGKSALSDIVMVIINVTDVNDNTPMFGQGDYSTEISEDLTPGHLVMKVRAGDANRYIKCISLNMLINWNVFRCSDRLQRSIKAWWLSMPT